MTISEMIKALETLKAEHGDIRVTVYDDYKANEGWDYKNEELWTSAEPVLDEVRDDDDEVIEKVVLIR